MKYLFSIVAILILTGCVSYRDDNSSIHIPLIPKVRPEIAEKMEESGKIIFQLGVIPGEFYGNIADEPRFFLDMHFASFFSLNMDNFEKRISRFATSRKYNDTNPKLTFIPSNVKFARLSTLGFDVEKVEILPGGLQDDSENLVMLAYFDRPCTIKGEIDWGDGEFYLHDINIPTSGIYKLVIYGSGQYKTIRAIRNDEPLYIYLI